MEQVLHAHGINTIRWPDGSIGLLNVPARWSGILSDIANGFTAVAEGDDLPHLVPGAGGKKRGRRV